MSDRSHEPRCPECTVTIQPDWDWCHACGYDPLGKRPVAVLPEPPVPPTRPTPPARHVYEPESRPAPVSPRLAATVAGVVVLLVAVGIGGRLMTGVTGAAEGNGMPGAPVTFERGITELDDGWSRIEIDEGAVSVELPGRLLRTRADLLIGDFGQLPMAVWGGGIAGEDIYGVGVADLPEGWGERVDELLATVPLPVGVDVLESQRAAMNIGEHRAVRIEANGPDGQVRAVVVAADDRLITLVYGSSDPADTSAVITRMLGSLQLG